MKQKQFEAQHAPLWEEIAAILQGGGEPAALPRSYRRLCLCLALAGQRGYSPALVDYLQRMVGDCHQRLYGCAAERPRGLLRLIGVDFPRRVRSEWRLLLLAALALWGVALAVGLLVWFDPGWAYSFGTPAELDSYRQMYQPGRAHLGRGEEGDVMMFGYYVWNNISICFRTFAGGLVGGLPALLSLVFNGIHTGLIAAWLSREAGTRQTFWSFVITHSSFEVTGLMFSGMAGLRLGLALIHPGRLSRRQALHGASLAMYPVLVGAALMTLLAAFFEAFWSGSGVVPAPFKYALGAACWLLVIGFFTLAGRRRRDAPRHAAR
jgi:uncharacterized membrane protein SpoIIM required for sporulation